MSPTRSLTQTLLRSSAVAALTSPHGVDRYLEILNPMWAAYEVRARILAVHRETDGPAPVATITLQPTGTWAGFRAGQYVQLGLETTGTTGTTGASGGRRFTRCFSISSGESGPGERFTLTVRANPDGEVSKFLVREARPGQVVHLAPAAGEFTLPDPLPARLLMISGGSGITPVMSMLRTLLAQGYDGHVTFLHYARSPEHQIFRDELAAISRDAGTVDVRLVYPEAGGEPFTAEGLARLLPDHRQVDTWACGPAGLVELVQRAYAGGDGPSKLRVEYFKTPVVSTGDAEGTVSFTRDGRHGPNTGATLLEQAEALGLTPEYGCRMGICFSCTSRKTEGTVRNVVTGAQSSLPDEDIQICVSAPVGDCAVDL